MNTNLAFAKMSLLALTNQDRKRAAAAALGTASPNLTDPLATLEDHYVDKGFALYLEGELGIRPPSVANKLRILRRLLAAMDCGHMGVNSSAILATLCRKGIAGIMQSIRVAGVNRSLAQRMALTLVQLCDWDLHRAGREGGHDAADLAAVQKLSTDARRWHRDSSSTLWNLSAEEESITLRDVALDGRFASYIQHHEGMSAKVVKLREQCMERFWAAIDCAGIDINSPDAIATMIREGALTRLQSTRLFALDKSWTRKIAKALRSWCEWQLQRLAMDSAYRGDHRVQLLELINAAKSAAVHWYRRCRPICVARCRARKRTDAVKILRLADLGVARSAACLAMRELADLVSANEGRTHLSVSDQTLATSIVCGLIYSLTVAGRSKPWVHMKESWARKQLFDNGMDYFAFKGHKTWRSLGDDVCYIAPVIKRVFEEYWKLPSCCRTKFALRSRATKLALRSPSGVAVKMREALLAYSKRYLPDHVQPYGVNLQRKRFTKGIVSAAYLTDAMSNRDAVACGMHSHSTAVGDDLSLTPSELAGVRKRAFIRVMGGEPPEWPERDPASQHCFTLSPP